MLQNWSCVNNYSYTNGYKLNQQNKSIGSKPLKKIRYWIAIKDLWIQSLYKSKCNLKQ